MNQITTVTAIALQALALRRQGLTAGQAFGLSALLRWALALFAAATFAGCGGGGSTTEPAPTESGSGLPALGATAVGTPTGTAVSKLIGTAGGQLVTADGSLTIEVPVGAFSKDEMLSIQEISNEVHGSPGRAWRIAPEGLTSNTPMTLRFKYADADLQGSSAPAQQVAYQDAQHRWAAYRKPVRDETGHTLTVETTHFSDWVRFTSAWLTPNEGAVKVGQTMKLTIKRCKTLDNEPPGQATVTVEACADVNNKANTLYPAINGHANGNATVGTIDRVVSSPLSEFVYTAPAIRPRPSRVAASVELLDGSFPNAQRLYLVSNIDVVDEARSCEWLRTATSLAFDVSYDPYSYSAIDGVESYEGHSSASLHGTLQNLMPPGNTTRYGAWLSDMTTALGQASLSDSHQLGDGKTFIHWEGSGAAHTGTPGSAVALNVDYQTCTYHVVARFWIETLETMTYDGVSTTLRVLRETATFAAKDQEITLPVKLAAEMQAQPMLDLDALASGDAGFVPEGQSESLRATATARVRWNIVKP